MNRPEPLPYYLRKYVDGYTELTNSRAPALNGVLGAIPVSEIATYIKYSNIEYSFDFLVKVCRVIDDEVLKRQLPK